ncbi:glycoside hydrolase family 79 protein [Elsinoe ampelina]|uniref:Glycoside hydrolase family 79 protein n=1 Tax=Elsinoe ampelina TaxID=302913 RepID=A0A6A6GPA8_9PEZI|nr:glycoside hydrolase family 79 protein [Elsinoe ampelina]
MAHLLSFGIAALAAQASAIPQVQARSAPAVLPLASSTGASIPHSPSFNSFSFEPAFWVEFFGNLTSPNPLVFRLLDTIHAHGGRPIIRPGGITMDSMIFSPSAGSPVRTTNANGGVYRTTVGPAYYQSWANFPKGTQFVSTLNFGNNSLDIARDLAVASVKYSDSVPLFELGNEPTNYARARWNANTTNYVNQWLDWTRQIDSAVNTTLLSKPNHTLPSTRWFASSATTDKTALNVRPIDLIPAGIDRFHQVADYSIHSYPFSTCDPTRARRATISNILNHTELTTYADTEIYPSARAALAAGSRWIIGEFNSISCSGAPNVTDTFAQALWVIDTYLIYAARNASAVYLHQGATLVFQSSSQVNVPSPDGKPGFSTYSMVFPVDTALRGKARALPSFLGQLFMAEALGVEGTRVLEVKGGETGERFAVYALFRPGGGVGKLVLVNSTPWYGNTTQDGTREVGLGEYTLGAKAWVKRLTAPKVDEKDGAKTTWAGQAFPLGEAVGEAVVEEVEGGVVRVRGSEAVLVFFDEDEARRVK